MWDKLRKGLLSLKQGENGVRLIVILGIVGLGLILLSNFLPERKTAVQTAEKATAADTDSVHAYCRQMESQMVAILERIEGVGSCQVMLTAAGTSETVYATEAETDWAESRKQEQKKCVIVSDSEGEKPLVQQVVSPKISGVIVVCDGASSSIVQERISNAVQAVLEIPANRICVVPGK